MKVIIGDAVFNSEVDCAITLIMSDYEKQLIQGMVDNDHYYLSAPHDIPDKEMVLLMDKAKKIPYDNIYNGE